MQEEGNTLEVKLGGEGFWGAGWKGGDEWVDMWCGRGVMKVGYI